MVESLSNHVSNSSEKVILTSKVALFQTLLFLIHFIQLTNAGDFEVDYFKGLYLFLVKEKKLLSCVHILHTVSIKYHVVVMQQP